MHTPANLFKKILSSLRKTMNSNSGFSIAGVLVSSAIGVVLFTSLMDSQLTASRIYKKLKISSDKEWTSTLMRTIISEDLRGIEQCLNELNEQIKLPTNLKFFWTKKSYSSPARYEYFIGVADSTSTETTPTETTPPPPDDSSNPGLRWRSTLKSDYPQVRVVDLKNQDGASGNDEVPECSLHQNESEVPCYDVVGNVGDPGYGKTKVGCEDDGRLTSKLTAFGFQAGGDGESVGANTFIGFRAGQNSTGKYNTFMGHQAGQSNTEGDYNTFIGHQAGQSNTEGNTNIFIGSEAGLLNTGKRKVGAIIKGGHTNIFIGSEAGRINAKGFRNTFIGHYAGSKNKDGYSNMFIGHSAGRDNTIGRKNTFIGIGAGVWNRTGVHNAYIGYGAGARNRGGGQNTFIGNYAGFWNGGSDNTFIGFNSGGGSSGPNNTVVATGSNNTFMGHYTGHGNTIGSNNTFMGHYAGYKNTTGLDNTFIGKSAGQNNTTGSKNTFIGFEAGKGEDRAQRNAGERNVFIGYQAGQGNTLESNKLIIANSESNTLITGFFVASDGKPKGVRIHGDLTVEGSLKGETHVHPSSSSDRRLKKNIKALDHSLEKLLTLKASTYYWKDKQKGKTKQIGFIAQDVEKVYPNLVVKNKETKMLSLNYIGLIPVIVQSLKEFYHSTAKTLTLLKTELSSLVQKNKKLEREIASLKKQFNSLIQSLVQKNKKLEREIASLKKQLNSLIQQRDVADVADSKSRKH